MSFLDDSLWQAAVYSDGWAVLRRAGQLWEEHAEVGDWLVRETGSIPPKAGVETDTAAHGPAPAMIPAARGRAPSPAAETR